MITTLIIVLTSIASIAAFQENNPLPYNVARPEWFNKFKFNAYMIWHRRQYYRLLMSGFFHANWWHLAFNMLTLYFFGYFVEDNFVLLFGQFWGEFLYALFYLLAIMFASISDLIKYRNYEYFNAIGASGAISAILFAAILIMPTMPIVLFFIPIPIPGYIFGILFLLYCQLMAKLKIDNIGHSAHFYGAVFGIIYPIIIYPHLVQHFINQF